MKDGKSKLVEIAGEEKFSVVFAYVIGLLFGLPLLVAYHLREWSMADSEAFMLHAAALLVITDLVRRLRFKKDEEVVLNVTDFDAPPEQVISQIEAELEDMVVVGDDPYILTSTALIIPSQLSRGSGIYNLQKLNSLEAKKDKWVNRYAMAAESYDRWIQFAVAIRLDEARDVVTEMLASNPSIDLSKVPIELTQPSATEGGLLQEERGM